jgi:hypothetical protein
MWASFEVGKLRRLECVIVEGFSVAYLFKMIASELLFEVTIMVYE